MNERIKQLLSQVAEEEERIARCSHEFNAPFYNPEIRNIPYGIKLVHQGSDVWSEPEGYKEKEIDRWTRVCKNCGFEQHTYKEKVIVEKKAPDFGAL